MTWEQAEAKGLVCLPAAGSRDGSYVGNIGFGLYWSSSAHVVEDSAYRVYFDSSNVLPADIGYRIYGYSVRLITESK